MGSLRRIGGRGQTLSTYVFKGWVFPTEGQDQMEEDKLRDYCNQIVCLIGLLGCLKGISNLTKDTCLPHPHKNPSWLSSIVLYLSEWFYNPLSCSRRNLLIILDSLQFPTLPNQFFTESYWFFISYYISLTCPCLFVYTPFSGHHHV